jgi:uncharacterized membrane protein YccC
MTAISGELESLRRQAADEELRLRLSALMEALQYASERIGVLVLTRRAEDELMVRTTLDELRNQITLLEAYNAPQPMSSGRLIRRVTQLSERCFKLMSRSVDLLAGVTEQRMFRSYSLIKTIYILHPKHWWRNIRALFNFDSHTARYAARSALASGVGTAIYKWFDIDHGYWLPFTVIIVLQPYFIATFRKAIDRLIGTVAGGVAGGIFLLLPAGLHIKEAMLFVSAIGMVHFLRTRYRISTFFITLNLVLLFSVSQDLNRSIILWRAGLTTAGAIIAVAAGFLLLPAWDRKWLPRFVARALERNWCYFRYTFSASDIATQSGWTKYKRQAEVSNSNVFDSFNRAMQEPGGLRKQYATYYQLITHNVRITRELNNIHLEDDERPTTYSEISSDEETAALVSGCVQAFDAALEAIQELSDKPLKVDMQFAPATPLPSLNAAQKLYLRNLATELNLVRDNLRTFTGRPGYE